MDVAGKKAIVFGGTSGIGRAAVERLVAGGASVVAVSRDPSKASDMGDGVTLRSCDVLDREAMSALLAQGVRVEAGGAESRDPFGKSPGGGDAGDPFGAGGAAR